MNALINTYLVKESVTIQMTFSVMKVVNLNMIIGIAMVDVYLLIDLVKESVRMQMIFSVMDVVNLNMIIGIAMGHVTMIRNLGNLAMEPVAIQKTLCVKRNVSLKIKHGNAMVNVNIFVNLAMGSAKTQDKNVANFVSIH